MTEEIKLAPAIVSMIRQINNAPDWADVLAGHVQNGTFPLLSGGDLQRLAKWMTSDLKRGRTAPALAAARLGSFANPATFLREARRIGVFRSSKLVFLSEPLVRIVRSLQNDRVVLRWADCEERYLGSVLELLRLGPAVQKLRAVLVGDLRKRKATTLKSCMVCVDRAFMPSALKLPNEDTDAAENPWQADHFSRERKASAFSTLVALMLETIGIHDEMRLSVDEVGIRNGVYDRMLMGAATIGRFTEAETLLDAFPYRVDALDGIATLAAIDDRLEQSVRLGYVQSMMQSLVHEKYAASGEYDHIVSLVEFAEELFRRHGDRLVERRRIPVDRYVMQLPMSPPFIAMISSNAVYREELHYLRAIGSDEFTDVESLQSMFVQPGVTVMDVVRFGRLFSFLTVIFLKALATPDAEQDALDMRSRIPVFREADLRGVFNVTLGQDLTDRLLELFSFDLYGSGHFDAQYTPILKLGSYYLVPLGVLTTSNLIRNVLCRFSARLLPTDGTDPMQGAVEKALTKSGFLVAANVLRKFDDLRIEIDLLAYRDGNLFVIECKNAYHPCSPHELRNSYSHVQKGGEQLNRAMTWLASTEAQSRLYMELGWKIAPTKNIRSCITTANRIFNGLSVEGHPVRQAREMIHFIVSGTIAIEDANYRLWRNANFDVHDLVDYLNGSNIVQDSFDGMVEFNQGVAIDGKVILQFKTFAFDPERVADIVAKKYVKVGSAVTDA